MKTPREKYELPAQRDGQALTMFICEGQETVTAEIGHWYSPDAVAELLAKEHERCAVICDDLHHDWLHALRCIVSDRMKQ
jgi:hypothetical protein